jgi:hypothetical protein
VCKGKLFSIYIALLLSVYELISSLVPCKAFNLWTRYATLLLDVDCQSGSQLSCSFNNHNENFKNKNKNKKDTIECELISQLKAMPAHKKVVTQ